MMLARSATRAARSVIPRYLSTTTPATSSGMLGTSAFSKILGSAAHVSGGEGSPVCGVPVRYKSTAALTDVADKVTNMQPVIDYTAMPSNAAQFVLLTSLVGYYRGKCGKHNVEEIVFNVVKAYASKDPNTVGHLVRLQFHDCIVRGCDASVLVDGPKTEKTAKPNLSLGGFEVVDTAKDVLESVCPGVVSCSDILILAARSAVALYGGKWYDAETGRRDGWVSSQSEALKNLPSVDMPVQQAIHLFNSRGLTKEDFVVLLGGHTVGNVHCDKFQDRLYNFYNTGKPDPRMNPALLNSLKNTCPRNGKINRATFLDQTPKSYYKIDNGYYKQLVANRGVLEIDVNIAKSPLTNSIVKKLAYSNDGFFLDKFGKAMIKMGRIGVLTGKQGEIRRSCRAINRH